MGNALTERTKRYKKRKKARDRGEIPSVFLHPDEIRFTQETISETFTNGGSVWVTLINYLTN